MRVFVTGATGYVGSAVVRELIDAGHQVVGLARSERAAASLTAAGAEAHRGDLADLAGLRAGAAAADGVIHTAFQNIGPDTDFAASCRAEDRAVEALGEALAGSGRPFVMTSGTGLVTAGPLATEEDAADPASPVGLRAGAEETALSFAARGVRVSVVRLSPSVHSDGDRHGFVPSLIGIARATGISAYAGDGSNRWPAVHRLDAARLYRLAVEAAPAGARLHAVGEEGVPLREIAGAIGRQLELPVVGVSGQQATDHFGWLAGFVSLDNPSSSALTRKLLGWRPVGPGLVADLDAGHYSEVE
ncbi:SDR family oxidoreductase [Streptomyces polygonati]|uniref:SDR family oxidoreductase n=1 Tax=Streptomyces polygonati TaxID=1617087 RepID=A0ABV8HSA6_9ACTN